MLKRKLDLIIIGFAKSTTDSKNEQFGSIFFRMKDDFVLKRCMRLCSVLRAIFLLITGQYFKRIVDNKACRGPPCIIHTFSFLNNKNCIKLLCRRNEIEFRSSEYLMLLRY